VSLPEDLEAITPGSEDLWRIYGAISEWIRFSDAKAVAILAGGGVVLGLTLNRLVEALESTASFWTVLIGLLTIAAMAVSAGFCMAALWPRLKTSEPATSLIYFEHIARRYAGDRQEFTKAMRTMLSNGQTDDHLLDQIWEIARVARRKFFLVGRATMSIGAGLGLGVIGWVVLELSR
jgi:hypothetical protein